MTIQSFKQRRYKMNQIYYTCNGTILNSSNPMSWVRIWKWSQQTKLTLMIESTFHWGVDSPVKMASFTIALPTSKSMSAGTVLSSPPVWVDGLPMDTTSPGSRSVPKSFAHLKFDFFKHSSNTKAIFKENCVLFSHKPPASIHHHSLTVHPNTS